MKKRRTKEFIPTISGKALDDATIQEFVAMWVKPIAKAIKGEISERIIVETIFNPSTRDVVFARATDTFQMPGKLYTTATRVVTGLKPDTVLKKDLLIICLDARLDYVKIEVVETEKQYQLSKVEYNAISSKIKVLK